jgi:very-short-patch-repair endonuclease
VSGVFLGLLRMARLPAPEAEYRFAVPRRWRFDYAWVEQRVALEVDGSTWTNGRHTRGSGWQRDTEKLNAAASLGWRMLRCTPQQLCTLELVEVIGVALAYPRAERSA